jgi:predicted metalloendopeptidase
MTDPHGADKFRINCVLKNVDRFYEAFGVGEHDAMYIAPEARVKIW